MDFDSRKLTFSDDLESFSSIKMNTFCEPWPVEHYSVYSVGLLMQMPTKLK